MNEKKKVFKRALLGLQQKDVECYINDLSRQIDAKDSKIVEMERTVRHLEQERHDLKKQLNILKEVLREQSDITVDKSDN